jgi:hypothetical protein
VLVADVGGGTTDFSLVKVELVEDGSRRLTRIGVGNHLILGGDNMDLALAHLVESRMAGQAEARPAPVGRPPGPADGTLPRRQGAAAGADAPEQVTVTLLGAGSRLIGASRSVGRSRAKTSSASCWTASSR